MRLIDADVLIEAIKNMSQRYCDCKDCDGRGQIIRVSEVIDIAKNEVQTAYDVEKVVEELEKELEKGNMAIDFGEFRLFEIVKQGGVSDDVCKWKFEEETGLAWHCDNKCVTYNLVYAKNLKIILDDFECKCPYCGKKIKVVE